MRIRLAHRFYSAPRHARERGGAREPDCAGRDPAPVADEFSTWHKLTNWSNATFSLTYRPSALIQFAGVRHAGKSEGSVKHGHPRVGEERVRRMANRRHRRRNQLADPEKTLRMPSCAQHSGGIWPRASLRFDVNRTIFAGVLSLRRMLLTPMKELAPQLPLREPIRQPGQRPRGVERRCCNGWSI